MAKQVLVKIMRDGRVQATVQGIKGKACTDYIKILEELALAETVLSECTPEYFESEVESAMSITSSTQHTVQLPPIVEDAIIDNQDLTL